MNQSDTVTLPLESTAELEVLLRKLSRASKDDPLVLSDAGLNEACDVFADMLETALEAAREDA